MASILDRLSGKSVEDIQLEFRETLDLSPDILDDKLNILWLTLSYVSENKKKLLRYTAKKAVKYYSYEVNDILRGWVDEITEEERLRVSMAFQRFHRLDKVYPYKLVNPVLSNAFGNDGDIEEKYGYRYGKAKEHLSVLHYTFQEQG